MEWQLVQDSILHLEKLAASLGIQEASAPCQQTPMSPLALKSKEALLTISILLPKLRAIRAGKLDPLLARRCDYCDE